MLYMIGDLVHHVCCCGGHFQCHCGPWPSEGEPHCMHVSFVSTTGHGILMQGVGKLRSVDSNI